MTDTPTALRLAREALATAKRVAEEARQEWDAAPEGMKAGKLLIALSGCLPGYRADIDQMHAALAALDALPLSDDGLETTAEERERLLQIAEAALRGGGDRFNIMAATMSPLLRDFDRQAATIADLTARVGELGAKVAELREQQQRSREEWERVLDRAALEKARAETAEASLATARQRVAKLEARLEIDHAYRLEHGEFVRFEIPPDERDKFPDKITCLEADLAGRALTPGGSDGN